jgi:hypothetical protein
VYAAAFDVVLLVLEADHPVVVPADQHGHWGDRSTGLQVATWAGMVARGRRRLAVVDDRGLLVGLLCLKRSGRGFCSAADVAARARDRRTSIAGPLGGSREAWPMVTDVTSTSARSGEQSCSEGHPE